MRTTDLHADRRGGLDVADPLGALAPRGDRHHLRDRAIVVDDLHHSEATAKAPMLIVQTNDAASTTHKSKDDQEAVETGILDLLTGSDEQRPWSLDDLIREYDDKLAVEDAVDNLGRSGLIHRHAGIVFPSRAAVRFAQLKW